MISSCYPADNFFPEDMIVKSEGVIYDKEADNFNKLSKLINHD